MLRGNLINASNEVLQCCLKFSCLTCVGGQMGVGSRTEDSSGVILKRSWLLMVLHNGFQISSSLLIAEIKVKAKLHQNKAHPYPMKEVKTVFFSP